MSTTLTKIYPTEDSGWQLDVDGADKSVRTRKDLHDSPRAPMNSGLDMTTWT